MSDHEEIVSDTCYETPVPELDDHRHNIPSVQRSDRPRRGTFDSLYAHQQGLDNYRGEDRTCTFDEAVVNEDAGDVSPIAHRSRRPTAATMDQRSVSPPNSVKAFAEARRRERALSVSDHVTEKGDRPDDDEGLRRTRSISSHQSRRSRPYTVDNDGASLVTNKSAEEDVCFPLQDEHANDELHIDFEYLETAMRDLKDERESERLPLESRVFHDLRPQSLHVPAAAEMLTPEGDLIIKVPSRYSTTAPAEKESPGVKDPSKGPPHEDPNRYSFFSSAWDSTIHAADFVDLVLPGEDVRGLFSFPNGAKDGVWWLNVSSLVEDEVRVICRAFGIHPLTIEDITTQESREKIEIFPSYYFACFRSFNTVQTEGEVEYEPFHVYVVVFREGTLSFSFSPNAHASNVRKRIAMLKNYVALSSDWICYALIDNIVDSFAPVIHQVEIHAEMIEDEVFIARPGDYQEFLRKIGNSRKNVMSLMRLLGGKADVLRGFTKRCNENYKVTPRMDIGLYLGDIQDHVVTMMNNLNHCEKILGRAHSNYLAQLSVINIMQTTDANNKLSKMTLLASIIVPMNVVTGLFGMNVPVPYGNGGPLGPFFVIFGVLVAFVVVCIALAKRRGWM